MRTRVPVKSLIFWPLVLVGLLEAASALPAQALKTVQIGEIGNSARVSLDVGDTLQVILKATVSTGYGWRVAANNDAFLAAGEIANLAPESKLAGASGRQKLSFTAKAPGHDHLVLTYTRPWEKKAKPARTFTLEVTIAAAGTGSNPASAVKPEGVLIGRYTAKLPCADCSGILETLSLYSPGPNQFVDAYYVDAMTYIGRPSVYVSAGKFYVNKGTPFNPDATVYALSLNSTDQFQNYLIEGDTLAPLDDKFNLVHSPYSMSLKRVN